MIRETGAFGARFPSLSWTGLESGLYVLRQRNYDIGSLHAKHRPRVRHALECFEVRTAKKAELLDQGGALNLSTMARQGRYDPEFGERRRWEQTRGCRICLPGNFLSRPFFPARAWPRIWSRVVNRNWLHILHQMSRQEDLCQFPQSLAHLRGYQAGHHRILLSKQFVTAMCRSSLPAVCTNTSCGSATK